MKRIILMVLYNIILVPYLYFKLCYYASHADKYPEAERYEVLKLIDRRAMNGGRITIDAHGVENLPAKDGFMFFPNHCYFSLPLFVSLHSSEQIVALE